MVFLMTLGRVSKYLYVKCGSISVQEMKCEQYESRTKLYGSGISENLLCYVICNSWHKSVYTADFTLSFSLFNGSRKDKDSSFTKCYPQVQRFLNIVYLIYYEFALLLFFRPFLRKYFYIEKLEKWISDLCFSLKNICFRYFGNYHNRNIPL